MVIIARSTKLFFRQYDWLDLHVKLWYRLEQVARRWSKKAEILTRDIYIYFQ